MPFADTHDPRGLAAYPELADLIERLARDANSN